VRRIVCLSIMAIFLAGCAATAKVSAPAAQTQVNEAHRKGIKDLPKIVTWKDIKWHQPWWLYAVCFVFFQVVIRTFLLAFKTAFMRTQEKNQEGRWKIFWALFFSRRESPEENDYYLPVFLGTIEQIFYPFFIIMGRWDFIGAWIGIKTAAQWTHWKEHRHVYMRFLVGNALVVLASFILSQFIEIKRDCFKPGKSCDKHEATAMSSSLVN